MADPHTHFGQPAYIAPISSRETPLVNNLIRFFSEDEIYAIAADTFGLPVDEFAAANRSGIVRELVGYAARQKKLEELDGAMVERRPFLVRVMG